jgi:hypothetical protein
MGTGIFTFDHLIAKGTIYGCSRKLSPDYTVSLV